MILNTLFLFSINIVLRIIIVECVVPRHRETGYNSIQTKPQKPVITVYKV